MTLFTIKYLPKNTHQVFGQDLAVSQLKDFVINFQKQKCKAALLYGPIGNGKTSSVYASAKELDYDLLEINSSDLRNQENMDSFLNSALGQQSLFFRPKVILVDEIDNISGVRDRGCLQALVKAIEKSTFPVILTANDPFDQKFKSLKKVCRMIEFSKLSHQVIAHALKWVAEQENIKCEEKAVNSLARQADGDLRGALIDFQACSMDNSFVFESLKSLSDRKRTDSIVQALTLIFKSSSASNALPALDDVDADLDEIFFWLDNNLPKEYLNSQSLAKAYEHLARADVFSGRIRRQQHWRFLVYIYNLLTAGISSAKNEKNTEFVKYLPTMRILRMWQVKMKNAHKISIAEKLAERTHTSKRVAVEQVPYLQEIFRQGDSAEISAELGLDEEEAEWLKR